MDNRENMIREIHKYQFRDIDIQVELVKSNIQYHGYVKIHQSQYPFDRIGTWKTVSDHEGNSLRIIVGDEKTYKQHLSGKYLEFVIDVRKYPNYKVLDFSQLPIEEFPDAITYHTFKPYKKKYGDVELYLRIPLKHYIFKNWNVSKELKQLTESQLKHVGYINNYHNDIDYLVTNITHPYHGGLVTPK